MRFRRYKKLTISLNDGGVGMRGIALEVPESRVPTEQDSRIARESADRLGRVVFAAGTKSVAVRVCTESGAEEMIFIPVSAFRMLNEILLEMAGGNAVSVLPVHTELTTQEAADVLNVSRPFLVEQLEKGALSFRKVGSHRRVMLKDVLEFKQSMDRKRLAALEELAAEAQELDMGY